jgi:hypothetical protein
MIRKIRCSSRSIASWLVVALAAVAASPALAQGLYYKEIVKDGRIYVFNIQANAERFEKSGEMGVGITMPGTGPNGETVVGDNEKALQLYFFKHNIPMAIPDPPAPAPAAPPWKISGLVFGDYYNIPQNHLAAWEDQHGFWLRRAYLTYDHTFTPQITTRLRLEMNGNGKLQGGAATPYVKDAYLKWTFWGRQQVTLGIQPSLTFDFLEGVWGLRHIEKTPLDLYRMDSSRDTGVTMAGPMDAAGAIRYAVQWGNESGNNGETDRFKGYRGTIRYEKNPGFTAEGMVGFFNRNGDADRTTAQIFVAYRQPRWRTGFQYTFQERKAASGSGLSDTELDVTSGFLVFDIRRQKVSAFARVDYFADPCADCSGIDYLPIDTKEAFTFTLVGLEWYLHPSVRFSPNVEYVAYKQPATGVKPKSDTVARLTFYWVW